MNTFSKRTTLLFVLMIISIMSFAQCEILNRVSPDESMMYYIMPVDFYRTKAKSLTGGIVTDKESYFLALYPYPFPEAPSGNKLKNDLELMLSDGNIYKLKHLDTRYIQKDTVMEMLYLIKKQDLDALLKFDVIEAKIDMKGEEGIRSYVYKLHKSALKEQLECFLLEEKEKKKK